MIIYKKIPKIFDIGNFLNENFNFTSWTILIMVIGLLKYPNLP